MFGLFSCKSTAHKVRYRIQSAGGNDNAKGFIVQKYQECCLNAGSFWAWQDCSNFKTLEEAREYIEKRPTGNRVTIETY